ncbi:MAG: hypothetical protein NXI13_13280 [Proteobacteria bacterium]|nr:hypothetical protein [Pseudomonadota bacterium]
MFRDSLRLSFNLYPYILVVILVDISIEVMREAGIPDLEKIAFFTFIPWMILAYIACCRLLSVPPAGEAFDISRFFRFFWRLYFLLGPACLFYYIAYFRFWESARIDVSTSKKSAGHAIFEAGYKVSLVEDILLLLMFSVFVMFLIFAVAGYLAGSESHADGASSNSQLYLFVF